jgi:hypothetical protein
MPKALQLHPFDVVVALRLTAPAGTLAAIGEELAASPSQIHAAIRRLELSGLLRSAHRATNTRGLLEFLATGVRYAFPAARGPLREGIPTAYSAPPLNAVIDALDAVVWPAPTGTPGTVRGFSLTPLFARAPQLVTRSPRTYALLTVVDALRLGDLKLRPHARAALEQALSVSSA